MPEGDAVREAPTTTFTQFLLEQRGGLLHSELSDMLADVVARCVEHGKKGSITIKLTIAPNKDGVTLTVSDEVKPVAPEGDRGAALFYADARGNLSRRDPRQPSLPGTLSAVEAPPGVDPVTGEIKPTGTEG